MEDAACDFNEPKWFFRSDDDPLNKNVENPTWTEFPDSEIIENAYSDYLYALSYLLMKLRIIRSMKYLN